MLRFCLLLLFQVFLILFQVYCFVFIKLFSKSSLYVPVFQMGRFSRSCNVMKPWKLSCLSLICAVMVLVSCIGAIQLYLTIHAEWRHTFSSRTKEKEENQGKERRRRALVITSLPHFGKHTHLSTSSQNLSDYSLTHFTRNTKTQFEINEFLFS